MTVNNNDMLLCVILIDAAIGKTDRGNRRPIPKTNLRIIKNKVELAFSKIKAVTDDTMMLTPFVKIINLINELIDNENMYESGDCAKKLIIDGLDDISQQINLFTGKYYESHDFDFDELNPEISSTLNRVIDSCIAQGYYFGEA